MLALTNLRLTLIPEIHRRFLTNSTPTGQVREEESRTSVNQDDGRVKAHSRHQQQHHELA